LVLLVVAAAAALGAAPSAGVTAQTQRAADGTAVTTPLGASPLGLSDGHIVQPTDD
jgi:hypothetical protein